MPDSLLPEHFQRIFEATPGAFLLLRPNPAFTIIGASEQYLEATLKQRDEVMGRPLFEVFPDNPGTPDANSTHNLGQSLQRVVDNRTLDVMAVQRYDVPRPDGDGFEIRYWSPVNAPVFDADGTLFCIVHRVDNVTAYMQLSEEHAAQRSEAERLSADKRKMEAEIFERSLELDRLNRDLRAANRELSQYAHRAAEDARHKDEFLAMLAHELRNPLSAMSSALQLLTMTATAAGGPRQQELLKVCTRQVKNLTRMVDDLLEMSRIDRGAVELQRAPLDLRDVVDSALHATRALFERHRLTVSTRIAPARFDLVGDATRLEQAVNNVLANAAKYSESGGNVELRLERSESGWARIVVRDEGRGIPPGQLEAIFDIFVQVDVALDRSRGGLGIGLALVRAIVQLHGGKVRADSAGLGHGSTFTIDLPLSCGAAPGAGASGASGADGVAAPLAASAKRHVVIVEDNADARESLQALVGAFGHQVATAASGDAGMRLILETRPDLAIVDIGLPVLDGFAVARAVRDALGENVRLVALTGYNSPQVRQQALDAGFDIHMAKPCTPEKLLEILAG